MIGLHAAALRLLTMQDILKPAKTDNKVGLDDAHSCLYYYIIT